MRKIENIPSIYRLFLTLERHTRYVESLFGLSLNPKKKVQVLYFRGLQVFGAAAQAAN